MRIAAKVAEAVEGGVYEQGVETVRADSLVLESREAVFVHAASGAATALCAIRRRDRLKALTADGALRMRSEALAAGRSARLVANPRSGRAALVVPAPARMRDDGGVDDRVRLVRPAGRDTMAGEALAASSWQDAAPEHWRALWEAELEALPTHAESRLWLVSGLLLPLWDRLPTDSVRVRTLTTDAGERLIGRTLGAAQAQALRLALGLGGGVALTAGEVHEAVIGGGTAFPLANGWRLARRRAMGMGPHRGRGAGRHRPAGAEAPRVHHRNRLMAHPRVRARCGHPRTPARALAARRGRARGVGAGRLCSTGPRPSCRRPLPLRSTPTPPPAPRDGGPRAVHPGDSP